MEATIDSIKYNVLLDRNELEVKLEHGGEPTPSREDVRQRVAAEEDIDQDEIEVVSIRSSFGSQNSRARLKVFEDMELEEYGEKAEEPVEDPKEDDSGETEKYADVVSGTIKEAKEQLKEMENPDYEAALEAEKENKNRKTLIQWLESRND